MNIGKQQMATNDGKHCSGKFKVSAELHKKARQYMRTGKHEYGGNTVVDFKNKIIRSNGKVSVGHFTGIAMPRGVVEWHSHPATCQRSNNECTVGLPSPLDMSSIAKGAVRGTLAHIVYAKEGTYVVRMRSDMRESFQQFGHHVSGVLFADECMQRFDQFFASVSKALVSTINNRTSATYAKVRQQFIKFAAKQGFSVLFFKGATRPSFRLVYDCGAHSATGYRYT